MNTVISWILENWVNIIAWCMEFFVVLFCIHGVFGEKVRWNWGISAMLVVYIVTFSLILEGVLPTLSTVITYIITFIYSFVVFRKRIWETVGCYVLSIIAVGAVEIISSLAMFPLMLLVDWKELWLLLLGAVSLMLSILFTNVMSIRRKKLHFKLNDKKMVGTIIICGLSMLFVLVDYRYRDRLDRIYYVIFIGLVIIVYFYWTRAQKIQFELEKRELELELQEIYGDAYKELLSEVRRKQHDFTNQLSAIYSMHLTATSLEDLVNKQKEYGTALVMESRYDKILIGCSNPVLAGYLYCKCSNYEKSNVLVEYKIHVDEAECSLPLHEVIEILGILLTNAFESINEKTDEHKMIALTVEESNENLGIEVSNPSPYITMGEIEKLFGEGYSTKGKNRGIGLARVRQLARKCWTEIIVENHMRSGNNWISFQIMIPKKSG